MLQVVNPNTQPISRQVLLLYSVKTYSKVTIRKDACKLLNTELSHSKNYAVQCRIQ